MRLLSYIHDGRSCFGALSDDGVVELSARVGGRYRTLREVLAADALPAMERLLAGATADHPLEAIRFLPVIPDAQKIICIGVNYAERNAEYRDGSEAPRYPSVFMRTRESLVGHGEPILRPPESEQLDYEGEIALIIGKAGRRIPPERAAAHVAGLSLMNEGSVRDWLRHAKFNVTQGKNFEHSGALGPWLLTDVPAARYRQLHLRTRVNGETRQDDTTANLMFPFSYLLHYLSTFMRLQPGDVIATGTPNGAGARLQPPRYLQPGDVVEVEVAEIGTLRNPVADEPADGPPPT